MRSYIVVLACIFRLINFLGAMVFTTSQAYSKVYISGSLFGALANFSIFTVISVQSKAFKKSIENCVEQILCRFLAKKVFYTIRISEVFFNDVFMISTIINLHSRYRFCPSSFCTTSQELPCWICSRSMIISWFYFVHQFSLIWLHYFNCCWMKFYQNKLFIWL